MTPADLAALRPWVVGACSLGLMACGVWHIAAGEATERIFQDPRNVRPVGSLLLLAAMPCLIFRGAYFTTLGVILGLSGALRLFAPAWNIRLQKRAYPRWVHGWVMLVGGAAWWLLYRRFGG